MASFLLDSFRQLYWLVLGNNYVAVLKKELKDCKSVLDLGCGKNSPIQYCQIQHSVGIEAFSPYLETSKNKKIHNLYLQEDIRRLNFEEKSFDAVVALEVIEHMPKEDALILLRKMDLWARKKIVISTPNGFLKQEEAVDKNYFQKHLSGWQIKEIMDLGFQKIFGIGGLKKLNNKGLIADITQRFCLRRPEIAFGILAIKEY